MMPSTRPDTGTARLASQSWKIGAPESLLKVRVNDESATVGRNHPEAPEVSAPLPVSVAVPGAHVGTSVNGPGPVQLLGFGLVLQ